MTGKMTWDCDLETDQQLRPEKLPEIMTCRVSWMGDLENDLDPDLKMRPET